MDLILLACLLLKYFMANKLTCRITKSCIKKGRREMVGSHEYRTTLSPSSSSIPAP